MPWRIEREGTRLRIWIGWPMNDWDVRKVLADFSGPEVRTL
jgi:hypothetical protein